MRRLLLALERSDDDSGAVAFARSLARRGNVEILLLRVEEWPLFGSFSVGWAPAWRSGDLEAVQSSLEADEGVRARILSSVSTPSAAVVPRARLGSASLIVLPCRRDRSWIRLMSGDPADRILRESTLPVLAVPSSASSPPPGSRILFAYEDGDAAVSALRHVIEFAQRYEAVVALLRLRNPAAPSAKREAEPAAERLMSILRKRDVAAEVLPDSTDAPADLLSRRARNGCGLIVLSKTAERRRALTSLSRALLQAAPIPLLLIGADASKSGFVECRPPLPVGI
jgi:nucleotide-binding universal stress UspA family protein